MIGCGVGTASVKIGVNRAHERPLNDSEQRDIERAKQEVKPTAVQMYCVVQDSLVDFIRTNRETEPLRVAKQGTGKGRTLAICGAGPSLAQHEITDVDDIWACNSALTFLLSRGTRVTAAVGIDQSPGLLREWVTAPPVPYLLASSVDPALVAHLQLKHREITFFHNLVGVPDELALYKKWPSTCCVTAGFMVTTRALSLAEWMGYERIDLYGCDCAFGPDHVTHANGETAEQAYINPGISTGYIDGRKWETRADMLIGAVDLARRARRSGGSVRLIGDTLPNALIDKPEEYLDLVARHLKPGETP